MENAIFKHSKLILRKLSDYINYLFEDTSYYHAQISIPGDILYRTELMCQYISKHSDLDFELDSFIKIIYLKFINDCVEKYDPKKVYKMLTSEHYNIIISNGTDECIINRSNKKMYSLYIELPYEDVKAGELILRELYELYKYKFSFKTLLEQLWLDFINQYKTGKNKKAMQELKSAMIEYMTVE